MKAITRFESTFLRDGDQNDFRRRCKRDEIKFVVGHGNQDFSRLSETIPPMIYHFFEVN